MNYLKLFRFISFIFFICSLNIQAQDNGTPEPILSWSELPELPPAAGKDYQPGVAGPFVGILNGALIVAGGANFPKPVWENNKEYHDDVYILIKDDEGQPAGSFSSAELTGKLKYKWIGGFHLDQPIAYGASISTDEGVICLGGNDSVRTYTDVFLLRWDPQTQKIHKEFLPGLPVPCTNSTAARIGNTIYLAGGQNGLGLETAMCNFWALDLSKRPDYTSMTGAVLIEFADKRGITLTAEEKQSILVGEDEIRTKENCIALIEKLIASDACAARFNDMKLEQLVDIAIERRLEISKDVERDEILQALLTTHWSGFAWQELPPWPGPSRAFNITVAQHNGETDCIYVISGRRLKINEGENETEFLTDVYEFNPKKYGADKYDSQSGQYNGDCRHKNPWRKRKDLPYCVMAGTGIDVGQSHIFILGGADGSLVSKADELKDNHPGFPKRALAYHTITDTWINGGAIPANHVTTTAVKWDDSIIIPSGEIRPRVRSPRIWSGTPRKRDRIFGPVNFLVLVIYLLAMVGVGVYFAKKNKNTDDYFRGGQRIPWWVAGCSIFATMLSSITYMSVPAKAYATNWEYFVGFPPILITAGIVVYLVLPFFRQIDATSAYEYLEKRFNRATRLIGSSLFVMFQIGRMAIVMFLSALALAAITPFTEAQCILIMGALSIIYCTLGGIEAVVWTDTIQTFVLLGGAFLIFGIILTRVDGGINGFFAIANMENKFHAINWNWDSMSYMTTAFWVITFGSFGQNLVSYTSDQAVVQRYMTTPDQKRAARAIWTNGIMAVPAGALFFALGTALFVFYKSNPAHLDPTFKTDAVLPLFIAQELPVGIAGLIVAGIFAAAQSTISTSMNSTATAIVTDFFRPFNFAKSEKSYLNLARLMTFLLGLAGTIFALLFSTADIKSLFDSFITVIGLFGGSLGGLFLLGMFTRRANGTGAVVGALTGAVVLYLVKTYTATHLYLYAFVGIVTCFVAGYLTSILIPVAPRSLKGLTVFTIRNKEEK